MSNRSRLFTVFAAALLLALGSAGHALAQQELDDDVDIDIEVEQERPMRDGLIAGVEIGGGHLDCNVPGCEGFNLAGGLAGYIGAMITPNLAITGDVWGMAHRKEDITVMQGLVTVGPRLWLGPFWARAGVGVSRVSTNVEAGPVTIMESTDYVPAAEAAVGLDFLSTDDITLDIRVRAGSGFFDDAEARVQTISIGVGANWH